MENLIINQESYQSLESIKKLVDSHENIIPVDACFYFTKGIPGRASGYILRDKVLEEDVMAWIETRTSFYTLMERYKEYYPELISLEKPRHYATRFINISGLSAIGENIFMFFPEVMGIRSEKEEDYFGFEFIDAWHAVFDEIVFPCMRKVFDKESQLELFATLKPVLEKTIYLASVFHEIGHRCGYWKVSPRKDPRMNVSKFNTDVLGELSTDTLLVNTLNEFHEILYFVFLQRLFWFGRFGFKENPMSGKLNEDNDTWIGAYLWKKYIQHNVLTKNDDHRWHINFDHLKKVFFKIQQEIDQLGKEVAQSSDGQDGRIRNWMRKNLDNKEECFLLPEKMQSIFIRCVDISEKPSAKYF